MVTCLRQCSIPTTPSISKAKSPLRNIGPLYWDQANKEIYTDCYVRMFSNDGFLQGFGMRSDEMARNARIFKAFNSDLVVVQDSTKVIIDSVNFIGPLLKK